MKPKAIWLLLISLSLLGLLPGTAGAYSYGNANTEALAESFKVVAAKLAAEPPDWKSAQAAYEERRAEIKLHFGAGVVTELTSAFEAQDRDRVIADMLATLVLNIERRFKYAQDSFADYNQAKLLLAKSRATYETLKPYLTGKLAETQIGELDADYEKALGALGNPGLFGAGKKEPDQALFERTLAEIDGALSPLFPPQGAMIGSVPEDEGAAEATPAASSPAGTAGGSPSSQGGQDKTNPVVTIAVLGGVAVVAGLAVWATRRRRSR
ncbi:hypothetical protein [Cohnella sp. 56]|uniref:hypothetical protein n=1 Tax=Cohnella sp. 56 TaxID=3113722 RepID=UPI0030E99358